MLQLAQGEWGRQSCLHVGFGSSVGQPILAAAGFQPASSGPDERLGLRSRFEEPPERRPLGVGLSCGRQSCLQAAFQAACSIREAGEIPSCWSNGARPDKLKHVLPKNADMSVGATSGATDCLHGAQWGRQSCLQPPFRRLANPEHWRSQRCFGVMSYRYRDGKPEKFVRRRASRLKACCSQDWLPHERAKACRRPERPPAGTIACHTTSLAWSKFPRGKRVEMSLDPAGKGACDTVTHAR